MLQAHNFRHFDILGPKINPGPGCLKIITYTKFGDPLSVVFDLSCRNTFFMFFFVYFLFGWYWDAVENGMI